MCSSTHAGGYACYTKAGFSDPPKAVCSFSTAQDSCTRRGSHDSIGKTHKTMNHNLATILAVIAILFVLLTYISGAPLVPVAVILLALAIIFGGSTFRRV
jgi:type IV secretory pathway VirB2 component (pilin)